MRRGDSYIFLTRLIVALIVAGGAISLIAYPLLAQTPSPDETFRRPAPVGPTRPEIPSVDRMQEDKIFLERADSLFRVDRREDVKIVKGDVMFRQQGTVLTCDSAYFYTEQDRADCFGNVLMTQGDTLFIYADKIYYNGFLHLAQLGNGPTAPKVRLINRHDTLITDSLDYNLQARLGWYSKGGELRDPTSTLSSVYGQYSPATKNADFYHNVVLVNRKDGYRLLTDTLFYNTATGLARIKSRTVIESENDTIITTGGTYNTDTGFANLFKRSLILHRDSNQNVVTLEGDSIVFDRDTEISRAYRYRAPGKKSGPVIVTDTANKSVLIGGYGYYDNRNRTSMATDYPLLMEYSRTDTTFLRADTIRTFVMQTVPPVDSLGNPTEEPKEYYMAKAYHRSRVFRPDIQGVADSITFVGLDSMLYLHRKPVVWSDERQVSGEIIEVHLNDSTADWVRLPQNGLMMEHVDEDFFNQLSARKMFATLGDNSIERLEAEGNVMAIMLPMENDSSYNKLVNAESSFLDVNFKDNDVEKLKMWPKVNGTVSPIGLVTDEQKMLKGAVWLDAIRPLRRWYGDRVEWEDHLGEISDELEEWFSTEGIPPSLRKLPDNFRPHSEMIPFESDGEAPAPTDEFIAPAEDEGLSVEEEEITEEGDVPVTDDVPTGEKGQEAQPDINE